MAKVKRQTVNTAVESTTVRVVDYRLAKNYQNDTVELYRVVEEVVDGKKVVKEELVKSLNVKELNKDIVVKLAVYGLYVKTQRATAGMKKQGKSIEEMIATMQSVMDNLERGNWEARTASQLPTDVVSKIKELVAGGLSTSDIIKLLSGGQDK